MNVRIVLAIVCVIASLPSNVSADETPARVAPLSDEQQLPFAMHSKMDQLPQIRREILGDDD